VTETIAHITDIHLDEAFPAEQGVNQKANWDQLIVDLKARGIKKIIFGGDIGAPSALPYFLESLTPFEWTISPGNHDLSPDGKPHLPPKADKDGFYGFQDDVDYRHIFMDSSTESISVAQTEWLKGALNIDKKIILAVHHPVLPVPSYIDSHYALKGREKIQKILQDAGNEVTILCGHYHLEDERTERNIRQLLTPAASYLLEKSQELTIKNDRFGYRLLHISPQSIDTDVIYLKPNN